MIAVKGELDPRSEGAELRSMTNIIGRLVVSQQRADIELLGISGKRYSRNIGYFNPIKKVSK